MLFWSLVLKVSEVYQEDQHCPYKNVTFTNEYDKKQSEG